MAKQAQGEADFEIGEDRSWQERTWAVQRIAWIAMALFVLATLFGATGSGGPLASARVLTGGGSIDHPRIARWQAADEVIVNLPPGAAGEIHVELERSFVDLFGVESVQPEPSQVIATAAGHRFSFDLADGSGAKTIVFHVRPSKPAFERSIRARIGDGRASRMVVTVLP